MDNLRLNEKHKLNIEINSIKTYIKRNKETIERLQSKQTDFNKKQIQKITLKNEEYDLTLETLDKKINDLCEGKMDEEIRNKCDQEKEKIRKKEDSITKKTIETKNDKNAKETVMRNHYDQGRGEMNDFKLKKEYDKFASKFESIPEYVLSKLKDMNNNKGIVYKGIFCFGEQNKSGNNMMLFENLKGITRTHEFNDNDKTYSVYEKLNGKSTSNVKKLISKVAFSNL